MRDIGAAIGRLIDHQGLIDAILRRGDALLRAPMANALDLGRGRWELARALSAYQHFKHAELLDPLIARGSPAQAQVARRMKAACIAFGMDFRAHLMLWGSSDILDDWARYQPDAIDMIRRIRTHMTAERRQADLLPQLGSMAGRA